MIASNNCFLWDKMTALRNPLGNALGGAVLKNL